MTVAGLVATQLKVIPIRSLPGGLGHHARIASLEHIMKGHPEVVDYLKQLLRGELAARDQYFLHSRRYEDQGLMALYERINHEMQEETEHADALLRRILFLEGDPDMRPSEFAPGKTVVEMSSAIWWWNTKCALRSLPA